MSTASALAGAGCPGTNAGADATGMLELLLESVGCGEGWEGGTKEAAFALNVPLELIEPEVASSPFAPDGDAGWNAGGGGVM